MCCLTVGLGDNAVVAGLGSHTEKPEQQLPLLAEPLHVPGTQQPPVPTSRLLQRARLVLCCAMLCVCVTNIHSEHLLVLFLLSPLHPPLSVCQNTNGPLLGPCHLVSIHVTLVTTCLLDLCA